MPEPDGSITNRALANESIGTRVLANAVGFDTSVLIGTTGSGVYTTFTPATISLQPNTTIAAAKPSLIRAVSVGATGSTDEVLRLLLEAPTLDTQAGAGTQISLDSENASSGLPPAIVFRYTGSSTARPRFFIDDNFRIQMTAGVTIESDNLGSSTSPVVGIGTNYNDGMYSPADSQLALTIAGTQELFLSATTFQVPNVFNSTDAGAANVVVTASGSLRRNASALKYKPNWTFTTSLADRVLPRPITWPTDTGGQRIGYGAEHVAAYLPEAAAYEQYHLSGIVAVLQDKVERMETHLGIKGGSG